MAHLTEKETLKLVANFKRCNLPLHLIRAMNNCLWSESNSKLRAQDLIYFACSKKSTNKRIAQRPTYWRTRSRNSNVLCLFISWLPTRHKRIVERETAGSSCFATNEWALPLWHQSVTKASSVSSIQYLLCPLTLFLWILGIFSHSLV